MAGKWRCPVFRSGGFVFSTVTGRTRARVNVRPAPVPFRHPCWTLTRALCRAAFLFGATSHQHERNISWPTRPKHPHPPPRPSPRLRISSPGMSAIAATRPSGPRSEPPGFTATARAFRSSSRSCRSMVGSCCARRSTTRRGKGSRALSARRNVRMGLALLMLDALRQPCFKGFSKPRMTWPHALGKVCG